MQSFYCVTTRGTPHASLTLHTASDFCTSAHYSDALKQYVYRVRGVQLVHCYGVKSNMRYHYLPSKFKEMSGKRRWRTTQVRGSSSKVGKQVDTELMRYCAGTLKVGHKFTVKLVYTWTKEMGHSVQACQLPVLLAGEHNAMTQADVITRDERSGELWLWEVKTGAPVSLHRVNKTTPRMRGALSSVPCTKFNAWHLQLHLTRKACVAAGIPIAHARVIQVFERKLKGSVVVEVKQHVPPEWTARL